MIVNKPALATLLYQSLEKIIQSNKSNPQQGFNQIYELWNKVLSLIAEHEQLQFSTRFALLAYLGQQYSIPAATLYHLHQLRRWHQNPLFSDGESAQLYAIKGTIATIEHVFQTAPPDTFSASISAKWPLPYEDRPYQSFQQSLLVFAHQLDPAQKTIWGVSALPPHQNLTIQYGVVGLNEIFTHALEKLWQQDSFPITLNLLEVKIDENGVHYPTAMVIAPDYLIDVSTIAGSFQGFKPQISRLLLKKFIPFQVSIPLTLGNVSNFFLDELLHSNSLPFRDLFKQLFHIYPLVFCQFKDGEIKTLFREAAGHYHQLKQVVSQQLPAEGLSIEDASIEPTFYSEQYGLQGRLDVFFSGSKPAIIELKSGKIYNPNQYGLNKSHFVQTLLYDLLIRAAHQGNIDPINYILYSGATDKPLRYAPRLKSQQWEAIAFRNEIVVLEFRLTKILPNDQALASAKSWLFTTLQNGIQQLRGFDLRHAQVMVDALQKLNELEHAYFLAFCGMIAREHRMAKIGTLHRYHQAQAGLWKNSLPEKINQFSVINHLTFLHFEEDGEGSGFLHFQNTSQTNPLANFRPGDIGILYPIQKNSANPLHHQLFKGTIIALNGTTIKIRLRTKQVNHQIFQKHQFWNIEHDLLDSSFNHLYRSIFQWVLTPPALKQRLLGQRQPRPPRSISPVHYPDLSDDQNQLLRHALAAEDYFLLWGPPGTGKTSMMLTHMVKYYLDNTDYQILLMAYTNRAVDEICSAINTINENIPAQYFRVGSRFNTNRQYQKQLLQEKASLANSRAELLALIHQHRIVVATVASILGNPDLLALKKFQVAVIDEASQILEPQLIGLLHHFDKFILIGDHRQLPAVVTQPEKQTKISAKALRNAGFTDLRDSFFERLYKQCQQKGWEEQFGQLKYQGRMHQKIMSFPSKYFYQNALFTLPPHIPRSQEQTADLNLTPSPLNLHQIGSILSKHRLIFVDTEAEPHFTYQKVNVFEATAALKIIQQIEYLWPYNQQNIHPETIGIITPFRAQIATIKNQYQKSYQQPIPYTVDTVERYQGSARDIILISFCTNTYDQLQSFTSVSEEGIDRKLNVALTRARKQIILFGNKALLQQIPIYNQLISHSTYVDSKILEGQSITQVD